MPILGTHNASNGNSSHAVATAWMRGRWHSLKKNEMSINSKSELEELFLSTIIKKSLNEDSYSKTRCVTVSEFKLLKSYDLNFEPYNSIAVECGMIQTPILQSEKTNRFYIGFLNLGGHGAFGEIRPIRLKEILNLNYIKEMYENHGAKMDREVDMNENYEI